MKIRKTTKKLIALGLAINTPVTLLAQSFEEALVRPITGFKEAMVNLAPAAFIAILIVSAFFNIGKVWGQDRDYKAFFIGLGLYVLAISSVIGVIAFIGTLKFG